MSPALELHLGCVTWARTDIKIISPKYFAASRNACSSWESHSWKQSSTANPDKFFKMFLSEQITWIIYGHRGVAVWQVCQELVQGLKVFWSPSELNHPPCSLTLLGVDGYTPGWKALLPLPAVIPAPEVSSHWEGSLTNPIAPDIFFLNIKIPERSKMYLFLSQWCWVKWRHTSKSK